MTKYHEKLNKKWMTGEVEKLIDYFEREPEIERPSAQAYYRKFISTSGVDATWVSVKGKVRYMRDQFRKAEIWLKSNSAKQLEVDEGISSVNSRINKICPFYDRLFPIFTNNFMVNAKDDYTLDENNANENSLETSSSSIFKNSIEQHYKNLKNTDSLVELKESKNDCKIQGQNYNCIPEKSNDIIPMENCANDLSMTQKEINLKQEHTQVKTDIHNNGNDIENDILAEDQGKRRKRREEPNKVWTEEEMKKLIDFLEEEPEFEKPSAQIYYKKFLDKNDIDTNWISVKGKVRYMKNKCTKAETWRKSSYQIKRLLENKDTITYVDDKLKLNQICPFFNRLKPLFSNCVEDETCSNSSEQLCNNPQSDVAPQIEIIPQNYVMPQTEIREMPFVNRNDSLLHTFHDNRITQEKFIPQDLFVPPQEERHDNLNPLNLKCKKRKMVDEPIAKRETLSEKNNQRWNREEIIKLIDFLEEEREFEKPTARLYYEKFLKTNGVTTTWDLVRMEVRYLNKCFLKAETWRNSVDARLLENDEGIGSVNEKLEQMCPFYKKLRNIFGYMSDYEVEYVESHIDLASQDQNLLLRDSLSTSSSKDINGTKYKNDTSIETIQSSTTKNHSISELENLQNDRTEVTKIKINFEREKFHKEMEMRQKEIDLKMQELANISFEKEKFLRKMEMKQQNINLKKQKLELKRMEIEKNERIRILEIERDERLARLEIEMKYKNRYNRNEHRSSGCYPDEVVNYET